MSEADWEVYSLRATLFYPDGFDRVVRESWRTVAGEEPEEESSQPRAGTAVAAGTVDGGWLQIRTELSPREDLLWFSERPHSVTAKTLTFGRLDEILPRFRVLFGRWLETNESPVSRLAFGAVLLQTVDTDKEGYARLQDYLPDVRIDPDGSKGLLYQINRPRESAVLAGTELNRLSKWSVSLFQLMKLEGEALVPATRERFCRVELDLSTPPEREEPLETGLLMDLIDELMDLAREVSIEGDLP